MKYTLTLIALLFFMRGNCQSIELMPGTNNFFFDIQYLKPLKQNDYTFTLFSRTRGLIDYEANTNILSAAYVSYTSKIGIGTSVIGSASSSNGPGVAAGINFMKVYHSFSIFALGAVEAGNRIGYSVFTIMRFNPSIGEKWKLYNSLELFTLFKNEGHAVSAQRIRVGLDYKNVQFGLGANFTEFGATPNLIENYGLFIRKTFD